MMPWANQEGGVGLAAGIEAQPGLAGLIAAIRCRPSTVVLVWHQLNDEAQLALAEHRLDLAHDALRPPDRDPLTDLERRLAGHVPGRDYLVATTELVSIGEIAHERVKLQGRRPFSVVCKLSPKRPARRGRTGGCRRDTHELPGVKRTGQAQDLAWLRA